MFEFTLLTLNPFALRRSRYNTETTTDIIVVGKQPVRPGRRVNTAPFIIYILVCSCGTQDAMGAYHNLKSFRKKPAAWRSGRHDDLDGS